MKNIGRISTNENVGECLIMNLCLEIFIRNHNTKYLIHPRRSLEILI